MNRRSALKTVGTATAFGLGTTLSTQGVAAATSDGKLDSGHDYDSANGFSGEQYWLENGAYVEQYNGYWDPDYSDVYVHRIQISSESYVYEGPSLCNKHSEEDRLVNDFISVDWDDDELISVTTDNDDYPYVGVYESDELSNSSDDFGPFANAVVGGAVALLTVKASAPTAIVASMVAGFVTGGGDSSRQTWEWDWGGSGNYKSETNQFARLDIRQKAGTSCDLDIDVNSHAYDDFGSLGFRTSNSFNITLTAPY